MIKSEKVAFNLLCQKGDNAVQVLTIMAWPVGNSQMKYSLLLNQPYSSTACMAAILWP